MDALIMTLLIEDLMDKLKDESEIDIIEMLDLSSSELVSYLSDRVVDKQDKLREYYDEDAELDGEEKSDQSDE